MLRALVDRAKQGDGEAFDALARTVGDRCMAIACRILRDADLAEDAVQAATDRDGARLPRFPAGALGGSCLPISLRLPDHYWLDTRSILA